MIQMGVDLEACADAGPDAVGRVFSKFERIGLVLVERGNRVEERDLYFLHQGVVGGVIFGGRQRFVRRASGFVLIASGE